MCAALGIAAALMVPLKLALAVHFFAWRHQPWVDAYGNSYLTPGCCSGADKALQLSIEVCWFAYIQILHGCII